MQRNLPFSASPRPMEQVMLYHSRAQRQRQHQQMRQMSSRRRRTCGAMRQRSKRLLYRPTLGDADSLARTMMMIIG
jgi:hypothetical protein